MLLFGQLSGGARAVGVVAVAAGQMLVSIWEVIQEQAQPFKCRHKLVVALQRSVGLERLMSVPEF